PHVKVGSISSMASGNAITQSTDVFAALVANIAPLLILVGEKHVKSYMKTISDHSHLFLFAAGPIGLVTALTTLIRISDITILKRLIGRQHEKESEVVMDVTGCSRWDEQHR